MPPLPGFPPLVQAYESTPQFSTAINSQPGIVVLMIGTNDAMGSLWSAQRSQAYVLHYVTLINNLRKLNPSPKIYIAVPPPCYSTTGASGGGNNQTVINTILPQLVRQVAQASGLSAPIDTFTMFTTHCPDFAKGSTCDWMADAELHPNAQGYYQIASIVMHAIAADLNGSPQ
jgi:lysophospholipase L1-like esterase